MLIIRCPDVSTAFRSPAAELRPTYAEGELIKARVVQSVDDGLLLQIGEQPLLARSTVPLADGLILLQVIENNGEQMVARPVSQEIADDLALEVIRGTGLAVSEKRMTLVQHALASGVFMDRETLLVLDRLWQQLDYAPSWLPILMRLGKAKLPPNRLSAMAVRYMDHGRSGFEAGDPVYIYLDLTSNPPQFSLHRLGQKRDEPSDKSEWSDDAPAIVIGCDAPHLGPVLAVISNSDERTSIELLVIDEERQDFVAEELADLRTRLAPLVKGLALAVRSMPAEAVEPMPIAAVLKRLDIRI